MNIEQRKRVTIGVELAAKPELLLFLDEPTSGLDSDTAWSICVLLRKLADNGQAILCTIHQPSGTLFQMFDKLLFLSDGKSLYFGDIGHNSQILTTYFEKLGARRCKTAENPAEWILQVTNGVDRTEPVIDWVEAWRLSQERRLIKMELIRMKENLTAPELHANSHIEVGEFATSFTEQLYLVTKRAFQNNWRTPAYLYSQFFLVLGLVGHNCTICLSDLTLGLGHLDRVLFFSLPQQPSGNSESTLFGLHGHDSLYEFSTSDYASISRQPGSVRSSRTSIKNILVESVHSIKRPQRNSMANPYGFCSLCFMVLPTWHAS